MKIRAKLATIGFEELEEVTQFVPNDELSFAGGADTDLPPLAVQLAECIGIGHQGPLSLMGTILGIRTIRDRRPPPPPRPIKEYWIRIYT